MPSTQLRGAINTFGKAAKNLSFMGGEWDAKFRQGMISFSIDDFILFCPLYPPTHIKIDVDGIEDRIPRVQNTLSNPDVKSLLEELDTSQPGYDNT